MSTQDVTVAKKVSKKQVRQTVYEKLAIALSEYKKGMKDKRFEKNLQKASRLFAADITNSVKPVGKKSKTKAKKEKAETGAAN